MECTFRCDALAIFHIHERKIQNHRAKGLFQRKQSYKQKYLDLNATLDLKKQEVEDIQRHANDTAKTLGDALKKATDENEKVNAILLSKHDLEINFTKVTEEVRMLHEEKEKMKEELRRTKEECIPSLQTQLKEKGCKVNACEKEIECLQVAARRSETMIERLEKNVKECSTEKDSMHTKLIESMKEKELSAKKSSQEHMNDQMAIRELEAELRAKGDELEQLKTDQEKAKIEMTDYKRNHDSIVQGKDEEISNENRTSAVFSKELEMTKKRLDQLSIAFENQAKNGKETNEIISKERESEAKNTMKLMEVSNILDIDQKFF